MYWHYIVLILVLIFLQSINMLFIQTTTTLNQLKKGRLTYRMDEKRFVGYGI